MHSYLPAIGFRQFQKKSDIAKILESIINGPGKKKVLEQENHSVYVELKTYFGEEFGISIYGEYSEDGTFDMDYYIPFFMGYGVTSYEKPFIERHAEKESYAGLIEDFRVGISLIFYLNNMMEYKSWVQSPLGPGFVDGVSLAGLSVGGKILMPVEKTEEQKKEDKEAVKRRGNLVSKAKKGDEKAIESLTMEDLDIANMVGKRMFQEDILSIVETYFMPRGIECDQYSVLGEILDYHLEKNSLTKEEIYIMTIQCNDMILDVCMNKLDLLGEPAVGRRLKADIWLQGTVRYQ